MADLLTSVGTVVTSAISWLNSFLGVVMGSPLLLMFVLVSFVGLGVGLLRRLIKL